jgi:alpha-mannosidase
MAAQHELVRERLAAFGNLLGQLIYPERIGVQLAAFAAPDRISYAEAMQGDFSPIEVGHCFGPPWSTHWVRAETEIPPAWADQEAHLLWDSTCEACVWQDGEPLQGLTGSWNHFSREPLRPEFCLVRRAAGGERITVFIEVAVNALFGVSVDPYEHPELGLLRTASIARFDREAWDLYWDFITIADMARSLPVNTARGGQALRTATAMVNAIDPADRSTWLDGRVIAARFYADRNGDGQHNVSATGQSHLDTAWLWPVSETNRKAVRTFATALRYIDEYPDYRFAASQALHYDWVKQNAPGLYARLSEAVKRGRFIPVGGMWIEPDCLIPSGESLVRQLLVGQRFFHREFGIECAEGWLLDSFGFPAQLPQIMRLAGLTRFTTVKLAANRLDKMPASTFWWQGLDGTKVLAHLPPWDNYALGATPGEVLRNMAAFCDHERSRESALLFGYGDGGSGPTRGMIESLRRMRDVDGLPRVEMRAPAEFFARCEAEAADASGIPAALDTLTIWCGELYFERHRGCYTSQAATKRNHRQAECLLRNVEFLAAVAFARCSDPYPRSELDSLWKTVLLNQFHDILPGTSIAEVFVQSAAEYADVLIRGLALLDRAATAMIGDGEAEAASLVAINTLGAGREEVIELPEDRLTAVNVVQVAADGRPLARVAAPAYGCAPIGYGESPERRAGISVQDGRITLENDGVRATFVSDATLVSFMEKETTRECIEPGCSGNRWMLSEDVLGDAWDVEFYHFEKRRPAFSNVEYEIVEAGPLRVALRFSAAIGRKSTVRLIVSLTAISPRLDFAAKVDWREEGQLLRVEFPLALSATTAFYETQYGYVERPTHQNTSWDAAKFEAPAQRWAALAEPGFGIALLNDCKYGYSARSNVLALSLLRATHFPDPHADIGQQVFRYALYPFRGDLAEGGVVAEGLRFNNPLIVRAGRHPEPVSYFAVDAANVVLDTLKIAEESDALIVRLYEAIGARTHCRVSCPLPITTAAVCNLLEEEDAEIAWENGGAALVLRPFQILTLKLTLATGAGDRTEPPR